ncbi:MAG: site-2 protease family protein [Polyangiaceae bacterium]|jgi:membrane-associated protease RseP (regulator of RpoE activity)|nr:site-2 protease family protein [Polyangiaceae bacterium]MBK8941192.1 site-2 protease family protein [Polyangiaceae bacterium]
MSEHPGGATASAEREVDPPDGRWRLNLALFVVTVVSVFFAGAGYAGAYPDGLSLVSALRGLPRGAAFALPLLAILVCHELGHYVAARIHRVRASLPYFIPAPLLNPFGTMGAIIAMPERIRSRNALLDIGAAGPLAGLIVALPVLLIGLSHSPVDALDGPYTQEGQSLLYAGMKRLVLGPIPPGHDVFMSPMAFAGWTGLFVTALNLIPVGQLDGGHIAYALFGRTQDKIATFLHFGLLAVAGWNLARFLGPALSSGGDVGQAIGNSSFYVVWFLLLGWMRRRAGINHPPTDDSSLSPARKGVAWLCLALFVGLFMPTPWASYGG